jgi:hypothetical protein
MSYYRLMLEELCAFDCGSQSYCGSQSTCASSCNSAGFSYGLCTNGYESLNILHLVSVLILGCFSIVTSLVFVAILMALCLWSLHSQLSNSLRTTLPATWNTSCEALDVFSETAYSALTTTSCPIGSVNSVQRCFNI